MHLHPLFHDPDESHPERDPLRSGYFRRWQSYKQVSVRTPAGYAEMMSKGDVAAQQAVVRSQWNDLVYPRTLMMGSNPPGFVHPRDALYDVYLRGLLKMDAEMGAMGGIGGERGWRG